MGLTTREVGSSSFNDMISSIDRRSEFVENRAGANVTTNNALISYGLSNSCSILNAPCGYSNGVYPSLRPIQTFGPELVTNGTFDTDSDWNKNANWSISGGTANCDGTSNNDINQGLNLFTPILGKTYKISIKINSISQGGIRVSLGGSVTNYYNGTHTGYFTSLNPSIEIKRKFGVTNVSATIDNVSIKEVTEADFDFTRGSSATRVNEKGLIEDVQILSSNLVQNGDFEEIGSELVTNGDFSNGETNWDFGGNWTLVNGTAEILTGTNSFLIQSNVVDLSVKTYKIQYEVVSTNGSNFSFAGGNSAFGIVTLDSATIGVKTFYLTSNGTKRNLQFFQSSFTGSIDNVSVKEVGQNWTFGTGWSMGDGKVYFENPTGTEFYQSLSTTASKYRISFDLDITSGTIQTSFSSPSTSTIQSFTTSGTKTVDITTTASFSRFRFVGLGGSVFNIDNVSVIEITDDTDLPRINYTNFDYENGEVVPYSGEGSLLLENQSTNLITYSEDFSQWILNGDSVTKTSNNAFGKPIWTLTESSTSALGVFKSVSGISVGSIAFSALVKAGTSDELTIRFGSPDNKNVSFNLSNGTISSESSGAIGTIKSYGDGWYLCTNTMTITASTVSAAIYTSEGSVDVIYAQLEQGSYATSYIPTNGSTVTRLADVCNNSGSSDLINSTEGVLYAEISALADYNDNVARTISIINSISTSNLVRIYYYNNLIVGNLKVAGSNVATFTYTPPIITDLIKVALKYKQNDFAFWVNGVEIGSDLVGDTPIGLDTLAFNYSNINNFYGNVKCVAVFKEALSDTELQKLTTI